MPSKYNPEFWKELRETERIERQKTEEMFSEIKEQRRKHG